MIKATSSEERFQTPSKIQTNLQSNITTRKLCRPRRDLNAFHNPLARAEYSTSQLFARRYNSDNISAHSINRSVWEHILRAWSFCRGNDSSLFCYSYGSLGHWYVRHAHRPLTPRPSKRKLKGRRLGLLFSAPPSTGGYHKTQSKSNASRLSLGSVTPIQSYSIRMTIDPTPRPVLAPTMTTT